MSNNIDMLRNFMTKTWSLPGMILAAAVVMEREMTNTRGGNSPLTTLQPLTTKTDS